MFSLVSIEHGLALIRRRNLNHTTHAFYRFVRRLVACLGFPLMHGGGARDRACCVLSPKVAPTRLPPNRRRNASISPADNIRHINTRCRNSHHILNNENASVRIRRSTSLTSPLISSCCFQTGRPVSRHHEPVRRRETTHFWMDSAGDRDAAEPSRQTAWAGIRRLAQGA